MKNKINLGLKMYFCQSRIFQLGAKNNGFCWKSALQFYGWLNNNHHMCDFHIKRFHVLLSFKLNFVKKKSLKFNFYSIISKFIVIIIYCLDFRWRKIGKKEGRKIPLVFPSNIGVRGERKWFKTFFLFLFWTIQTLNFTVN